MIIQLLTAQVNFAKSDDSGSSDDSDLVEEMLEENRKNRKSTFDQPDKSDSEDLVGEILKKNRNDLKTDEENQ